MALSWVEIDLGALRHNFFQARARLSPATGLMAVVKSDAYGHGMVPVARELAALGVHFLGVSKFWEAMELRGHGLELPILVLLGLEAADVERAIAEHIRAAIFRLDHAEELSRCATRMGTTARIHIKVDTGMGRLGVPWEDIPAFLDRALRLPGLEIEGVLSHFAVADEADKAFSDRQLDRFREVLRQLDVHGRPVQYAHIANSAGLLDLPGAHFQLVRPGLMLYGSPPSAELLSPAPLRPVMSFKSRILQLKEVPAGRPIGYGRTFVTQRASRIATVPVGYDDGYSRLLSNCGQVLVCGCRADVVGRVSMNMITVDVSDIAAAQEDDEVVLLGAQGNECIAAEEIAARTGTISYEVFCNVGRHRFKFFKDAGD
jgi:alanine racemase